MSARGAALLRPRRTVESIVVALLLGAAAALVLIEIIYHRSHTSGNVLPANWLTRLGNKTHWNSPTAYSIAGVACALGLILLALALVPAKPRVVQLSSQGDDTVLAITKPALKHQLAEAATSVDGIDKAKARIRDHKIKVVAYTPLKDHQDLADEVMAAVAGRLADLAPVNRPKLRTTVQYRG